MNKENKFSYKAMFIACCGLTAFWGVAISTTEAREYGKPEALAALFSGWAFIAMFFALKLQARQSELQSEQLVMQNEELRLQREELKLQRAELEATRQELARTAEANTLSAELSRKNLRAQCLIYLLKEQRGLHVEASRKVAENDSLIRDVHKEIEKINEFESFEEYCDWANQLQDSQRNFIPAITIEELEKELEHLKSQCTTDRQLCSVFEALLQELFFITKAVD